MASKRKMSMRDKVRKRAEDRENQGGGGWISVDGGADFFSPEKKTNKFRIIPYEITVDTHPEVPAGELWYQRTVWVHYGIGAEEKTYVCPLKTLKLKCPICEERAKMMKDPDADEDVIKELRPRERELFNVLVDGEDEPQLMTMSYHVFGKKLEEEVREGDEEWGGFADLEDGYLLHARFTEKKLGKNKFLEASRIDFKQDDDLPEDILDNVYNLDEILNVLSYSALKDAFYETEEEKEEEEKPKRSPRKSSKSSSRRSSRKKEAEEEEEPEEKPKSSRKSSRKAPAKPKPKRNSRTSRKKPEPEESEECPFGHVYETDCNEHDDCDSCDEWEDCQTAYDNG